MTTGKACLGPPGLLECRARRRCIQEIVHCALEILPDNPTLLNTYEGFERAMWVDDLHMRTMEMDRDEYRRHIEEAYEQAKTRSGRLHGFLRRIR